MKKLKELLHSVPFHSGSIQADWFIFGTKGQVKMLRSKPIQRTQELDKTWELLNFGDDPPIHFEEGRTLGEMARVIERKYRSPKAETFPGGKLQEFFDSV
mmetsp:Transcript_5895/g.7258  ORF Transcript_5895/g.7258 Transcript_5895/m.7258 type:complete len:100 (-) Transcript_5895:27-326(-)